MTRHTPDFLRQRGSNLSLRMAAAEKAAASMAQSAASLGAPAREPEPARTTRAADVKPEDYTRPFCDFLQENPTIFHAVDYFKAKLAKDGFQEVSGPGGYPPRHGARQAGG